MMTDKQVDAMMALPDTLSIPLRSPIKNPGGNDYSSLDLQEPTAGQLMAIAKRTDDFGEFAIHVVAGWPLSCVRQLPAREFRRAVDYLLSFTNGGPATGPVA